MKPIKSISFVALIVVSCLYSLMSCKETITEYKTWSVYNGTKDGLKYSSLKQIDTDNVKQLKVAWQYNTGDADTVHGSQIQCNPIIVNGYLYGVGPQMKLFAIDAETGKEKWVFDANAKHEFNASSDVYHIMINSRGLAYWTDGQEEQRLFFTAGSKTYAINASNGSPIRSFGDNGSIDLHDNLGRDVKDLFVVNTSPGIVYKNLIILGTRVDEAPPSAPGHIRAYNVLTGELQWIFHTIPQPGDFGYETWDDRDAWKHIGGANVWSGFSLDEKRGILFAPTGSAAYDFYGGKRKGSNLFANSLLALDAATGKYIWHYQLVHHDLWDRDLPSPPVLITLERDNKKIDAVAQTTKHGLVYVFERETGVPVFEIEEVSVDTATDLAGEKVWPTQPIPKKPAPFARQRLTDQDINPYVEPAVKEMLLKELKGYRHDHMYTPPGKVPSLVFPGYDGGGEWGGPAFDPTSGILYVNANEMAWIMEMREHTLAQPDKQSWLAAGSRLYKQHCSACHGADRSGTGNNPSLKNIASKYDEEGVLILLNNGRRMMPAFKHLAADEKDAITSFILDLKSKKNKEFKGMQQPIDSVNFMPYKLNGYTKFLTPDGYPAISPPWGTLNAINLNTGEFVWKTVLGEYPELTAKGIPPTGTENYGGPVVTAGGLVFIGATRDGKIRAFNKYNGKLLWEYTLPAAAFATPAIYEIDNKQFLVIACGGGKLKTKSADAYVAFALPE